MRGERFDALRQRRIAVGDAGVGPAHRCRWVHRGVEIIAQGRAKRFFVTLGDGDAVDDRRPEILGLAVDDLRDRTRFGLEPLHPLVGLVKGIAGGIQPCACGDVPGLARLRRDLGLREILLRGLHRARKRREVAEITGLLRELVFFGLDVGDVLIEPRQLVAVGAYARIKLMALGGEVRKRSGELGKQALGIGERRFGCGYAFIDAGALFDARLDLFLEFRVFVVEPQQRDLGIRGLLLLTGDIGGKLCQAAIELRDAFLGALFLAVEQFAGIGQPL